MIAIDLLSMFCSAFWMLLPPRLAHGLVGGISVGMGFSVIGRTPLPERAFGMLTFLQFWLAGRAVMLLPRMIERLGRASCSWGFRPLPC